MSRDFVRLFWIAEAVFSAKTALETSPKFGLSLLSVGSASEASGASMFAYVFSLEVFGLVDAISPPNNNRFSLRLVFSISRLGSSPDASGAPGTPLAVQAFIPHRARTKKAGGDREAS